MKAQRKFQRRAQVETVKKEVAVRAMMKEAEKKLMKKLGRKESTV